MKRKQVDMINSKVFNTFYVVKCTHWTEMHQFKIWPLFNLDDVVQRGCASTLPLADFTTCSSNNDQCKICMGQACNVKGDKIMKYLNYVNNRIFMWNTLFTPI